MPTTMTNAVSNASTNASDDEVFRVTVSAAVRDHLYAEADRLDVPVDQVIRSILQRAAPSDLPSPRRTEDPPSPSPPSASDTAQPVEKQREKTKPRKTSPGEANQDGTQQDENPQTGSERDSTFEAVPKPEDLLPRDFEPGANPDADNAPAARSAEDAVEGSEGDPERDPAGDATVMDMLTSARGRLDALADRQDSRATGRMHRITQRLKIIRAQSDAHPSLSPVRSPSSDRVQRALQRSNLTPPGTPIEDPSPTDDGATSMFEVLEDDPAA